MKDDDALDQNPQVSRQALEAIHSQLYGWALTPIAGLTERLQRI